MELAKEYAARHRLTLGQAVSELFKQGAESPLVTHERSGLQVVHLGGRTTRVTTALVDRLRDEVP